MSADAAHRRDACRRLDHNVVVEAGAGTGKTTLLTDRLVFLLLGRQPAVPVTQLVALTFTEKAAAEIKLRLSERLSELSAFLGGAPLKPVARQRAAALAEELKRGFGRSPAELRERARRAFEDLDKAQIGTIHAFAAHLLRLHPLEAGLDPGFVVDEGELFREMFAEAWAKWLNRELGENAPRAAEWLSVLRLASLEDLEALARELCGEGAEAQALAGPDAQSAAWLDELAARLKAAAQGQPAPHRGSKIREALAAVEARLLDAARAARQAHPPLADTLPAASWPASKWPSGWDAAGAAVYEEAAAVAEETSAAGEALVRAAAALVAPFVRDFKRSYARAGLVSFDGLLRRARDLLRDHPAVREQLKARFAALLIDEFQDTDPLQGELLLYLAEVPGGRARRWEETRLSPGRLFVVGDPKQSIYRFRGADIAAYQRFTAHVLSQKGALACDLTANFRSPAAVLGPVNASMGLLMREEAGLQAPYKPLEAAPGAPAQAGIELVQVEPAAGETLSAEAAQRAEAAWIARWLSRNCGPGRELRFKDAAILVRSAAAVEALVDALRAAGVPYAVDADKRFYRAAEVLDLVNLLRALDDPEDRAALVGILRGPLCLLSDASLERLARQEGLSYRKDPGAALSGAERARVAALCETLRGLRVRVGRVPLGELVCAALKETGLVALAAKAYDGRQSVSNLFKFARLAAEASERRGATLKEFILRVLEESAGPRGEGESPLADEHLEAVRILTIHKAKGLEFPVVFLANASGARGGAAKKPILLRDWSAQAAGARLPGCGAASAAWARLYLRERAREEREAVRLLYVALTRSRGRLFVLGRAEAEPSSLSALLAEAGAWPGDCPAPVAEKFSMKVHKIRPQAPILSRTPAFAAAEDVDVKAVATAWVLRQARYEKALSGKWFVAPTDSPKSPISAGKPLSPESSTSSMRVGVLCHKVLEHWDFKNGGDLVCAVERARAFLEAFDAGDDWGRAAQEATEILEGFLASRAARELAQANILGREIPFIYEENGSLVRGSIDLLCESDRGLKVIDYKTDRIAATDAAKQAAFYEPQLAAYCEAVTRVLGREPQARLLFLRLPDQCYI